MNILDFERFFVKYTRSRYNKLLFNTNWSYHSRTGQGIKPTHRLIRYPFRKMPHSNVNFSQMNQLPLLMEIYLNSTHNQLISAHITVRVKYILNFLIIFQF